MNTATESEDVVRRNVKRELPCKLTETEFTRISRQRVAKEAELAQLQADLAKETKKRKDQIEEVSDEVAKMGRELHTEHQDRTVPCNDVFRRAVDGTGWIHTIRLDTYDEVERRPATAHETQRYLPSVDGPGAGLLDKARSAQQADAADEPAAEGSDVPPDSDAKDGEGDEDTDDTDEKPDAGKPKRAAKKKGK